MAVMKFSERQSLSSSTTPRFLADEEADSVVPSRVNDQTSRGEDFS